MPLSESFHRHAHEVMRRYPQTRSAILDVLHLAQEEVGYVSGDVIREVAEVLGLHSAEVADVVTFHTMYKRKPSGRYLISLCTNVSCALWGADETAEALRGVIGEAHEATEDGLMSWEPVECLAHCDWAPIAQVNYEDIPRLTPERARELCDALRSGRALDEVLAELRSGAPDTGADGDRARGGS